MHPGLDGKLIREVKFPLTLLGAFAVFWLALALAPVHRSDWLLENVLTLITVPVLIATYKKLRFSNFAYVCFFIFLCLHTVGSHYTYSLVPYDAAWQSLTGDSLDRALGFERNQYDRLVHFMYGLLIVVPSLELFAAYAPAKRVWRIVMPVFFIMGHSVLYEMIEWAAALVAAPELGQAYLGTQGDEWDAQKDMALATLGAIAMLLVIRWTPYWRDEWRRPR